MIEKNKSEKIEFPDAFEKAMKKIATTPKSQVDKMMDKSKKAKKRPMRNRPGKKS